MSEIRIRFNYEKACACIPAGIQTDDKKLFALIESCLSGSLNTSQKPEFLAQFQNLPDTLETQIKIQAALLDDVCARFAKAYKTAHEGGEGIEEGIQACTLIIRSSFALATVITDVLSVDHDTNPLFIAYLLEQLGEQKPNESLIEKIACEFLENFKIKEHFQENGIIKNLIATLIAAM
jgi:hypothetical protein